MSPSPAIPSRPLRNLREALNQQSPLDPTAIGALSDLVEEIVAREQAVQQLLCECYGVIHTGVILSASPETHPDVDLSERVMAAICGRAPEAFRKVAPRLAIRPMQAVPVIQEHAHA